MSGASVADPALPLAVHPTAIPGLLIVDLPVHRDNRGCVRSFSENSASANGIGQAIANVSSARSTYW